MSARPVDDLVDALGPTQPQVSKHLRVLREVGAVDVRDEVRDAILATGMEGGMQEAFDALEAVAGTLA